MTHIVCEGKALTTPRGIKGPGESVSADDFHGKTRLNFLVKKGYLRSSAAAKKAATAAAEVAEKAAAAAAEEADKPPPLPEAGAKKK